jgi:flagellar P-ring protein precursor FlgI
MGSGDSLRNSPFAQQSIASMMERMGVNIRDAGARTKNVAAVIVTAELPAFAGRGSRIDVTVSSLGDATSLAGGSLIRTPLYGADDKIYAVAQGSVAVAGFDTRGQNESVTQGVPTTGRIANGATVEREGPGQFADEETLRLELRNPDFATAVRIAEAINEFGSERFGKMGARMAVAEDLRMVRVYRPPNMPLAMFTAMIGELWVQPDTPARIVIDERTGTIVIGSEVRISTVAVTHGNLTVRVSESPVISQPLPFSDGQTVVESETNVDVLQEPGNFAIVNGSDLHTLVSGLNRMGLKPPGIIAIIQAMKSAGALHAELVVQ